MKSRKSFLGKYYLLLIYIVFLVADCWLLKMGDYGNRKYTKTVLMPILSLWFMSNTAFNITSSPNTLTSRLLLYAFFLLTWTGDICGLFADVFVWRACLILYSITYLLALLIVSSIQINLNEDKKFVYHYKTMIPTFILALSLALAYIYKLVGFEDVLNSIWFVSHCILLSLLAAITTNMVHTKQIGLILPMFFIAALFLLLTNGIYGVDELLFHRTHHSLDVVVAVCNGIFQISFTWGILKFVGIFHKKVR
jgi:hypothetical protein